MSGAADMLSKAAIAALGNVSGIGRVYDAPPLQAVLPHALVTIDGESDWSHKSGDGRELRLAVTIFDEGERPERLRRLAAAAETAVAAMAAGGDGWRVVTIRFLRTRTARERDGRWAAAIEFRARLLSG